MHSATCRPISRRSDALQVAESRYRRVRDGRGIRFAAALRIGVIGSTADSGSVSPGSSPGSAADGAVNGGIGDARTQPFGCDVAFGAASAGVAIAEMGGEPDFPLDRRNAAGASSPSRLAPPSAAAAGSIEKSSSGRRAGAWCDMLSARRRASPRARFSQAASAGLGIRPGDRREINSKRLRQGAMGRQLLPSTQPPAGHVRGQGVDDAAVERTLDKHRAQGTNPYNLSDMR